MPTFAYSARDKSGNPLSGELNAPNRRDALRLLSARGLSAGTLTELAGGAPSPSGLKAGSGLSSKPSGAKPRAKAKAPASDAASDTDNSLFSQRRNKPTKREKLPFLQALFDLTNSGLSAGEAIRLLSVRLKEPALKALCVGMWELISEGAPLSRAMGQYPKIFDSSTVNLIAAGEATGSITETLARIIEHDIKQAELRRQILSAIAYPVFMLFVASGVVLFFLFYLLPKMQVLLSSLGGRMPASTQLLISVSDFAVNYGALVVGVAVFFGISLWRWSRTEAGGHALDRWLLQVPLVGSLAASRTVLAISQNLAVLLENGITTAEALRMTERQITNSVHREAFADASARVLEGEALSLALGRTRCFPDLVLDRLAVGENTGNIVPSLKSIARTYHERIGLQLNAATRVLTTVFMIGVFAFVAFIAFAIVSAVFSVSSGLRLH